MCAFELIVLALSKGTLTTCWTNRDPRCRQEESDRADRLDCAIELAALAHSCGLGLRASVRDFETSRDWDIGMKVDDEVGCISRVLTSRRRTPDHHERVLAATSRSDFERPIDRVPVASASGAPPRER
jgi:hypothetical protein